MAKASKNKGPRQEATGTEEETSRDGGKVTGQGGGYVEQQCESLLRATRTGGFRLASLESDGESEEQKRGSGRKQRGCFGWRDEEKVLAGAVEE